MTTPLADDEVLALLTDDERSTWDESAFGHPFPLRTILRTIATERRARMEAEARADDLEALFQQAHGGHHSWVRIGVEADRRIFEITQERDAALKRAEEAESRRNLLEVEWANARAFCDECKAERDAAVRDWMACKEIIDAERDRAEKAEAACAAMRAAVECLGSIRSRIFADPSYYGKKTTRAVLVASLVNLREISDIGLRLKPMQETGGSPVFTDVGAGWLSPDGADALRAKVRRLRAAFAGYIDRSDAHPQRRMEAEELLAETADVEVVP